MMADHFPILPQLANVTPKLPAIRLEFDYTNHLGHTYPASVDFLTFSDFVNYMRWEPLRGMAVGYTPKDERYENRRESNVKLYLVAPDGILIQFDDYSDLTHYLALHKDIAWALSMP